MNCKTCGHPESHHSDIAGCIAEQTPPGQHPVTCACEAFVPYEGEFSAAEDGRTLDQTVQTQLIGGTIPARHSDPETSHAATRAITVRAGTQRAHLLQAFASPRGADGLTDEEAMESSVGVSPHSEYAKRCSELRDAGFIQPTGETRDGNSGQARMVSRITEEGRRIVSQL